MKQPRIRDCFTRLKQAFQAAVPPGIAALTSFGPVPAPRAGTRHFTRRLGRQACGSPPVPRVSAAIRQMKSMQPKHNNRILVASGAASLAALLAAILLVPAGIPGIVAVGMCLAIAAGTGIADAVVTGRNASPVTILHLLNYLLWSGLVALFVWAVLHDFARHCSSSVRMGIAIVVWVLLSLSFFTFGHNRFRLFSRRAWDASAIWTTWGRVIRWMLLPAVWFGWFVGLVLAKSHLCGGASDLAAFVLFALVGSWVVPLKSPVRFVVAGALGAIGWLFCPALST